MCSVHACVSVAACTCAHDWVVCVRVCKTLNCTIYFTTGNLLSGLMDSLTGATNSAGPAVLQPKPPLDASQEELD